MDKKRQEIPSNIREILPNIELFAQSSDDYINSLEMAVNLLQSEVENLRNQLKPKSNIQTEIKTEEKESLTKSKFLRCSSYEEVFSNYYEIVAKYLSITESNIFIYQAGRELKSISSEMESLILNSYLQRLVEEGIADWAIDKKEPSIIPNIYSEETKVESFFLIVPFYLLDNAIGLFLALTPSNGVDLPNSAFTELSNEAENASLAIDNLRSSEEISSMNSKLSALNNQMMRSSKLASIGELTTAISSEMSNPLQVIKANLKLLRDGVGNKTRRLDIISQEVDRITELNTRLSSFGDTYNYETSTEKISISGIFDELMSISSSQLQRDGISIDIKYEQSGMHLLGAKAQIQQALLNLLFFTRDTMPDGGKIKIVVSNNKNKYINIIISDNGNGIREEYLSKVFEPTFSEYSNETRIKRGLFLVKNMIEQHKGNISVFSEIGKGTTFRLTFPLFRNEESIKDE